MTRDTIEVQTGELLHAFTRAELAAERILRRIPEMSRDERMATFSVADTNGTRSWMIKPASWRPGSTSRTTATGAYLTLAGLHGVSARYYVPAGARVEHVLRIPSWDGISLTEFSWYRGAAEAAGGDRKRALALLAEAQDRKAADPTYSVTDFRLDLSAGMPPPRKLTPVYREEPAERPAPTVGLPVVLDWIAAHPEAAETIQQQAATTKENHQLINASGNNEWYTPRPFLDAAHELMGSIDLDPASNERANLIVRARRFFTIEDDGLAQPWAGRVWLNPPYGTADGESNQARWSRRLLAEYRAGRVSEAILLVNAVTGNTWFSPLKQFPICFPDSRIRFYNADTAPGQPTHSNALIYFGPNVAGFEAIFARFGAVLATRGVWDGAR